MFGQKIVKMITASGKNSYWSPQKWNWILPPWFINQNNPLHPDYIAGKIEFYNYSCRSWTAVRAHGSKTPVRVDTYGIIYLAEPRISIEIWLYHQQKLYTPGNYPEVQQRFNLMSGGIDTGYLLDNGYLAMTIAPECLPSQNQIGIRLYAKIDSVDFFEPVVIALIIRPYDDNGLAPIYAMKYKDGHLEINRRKVLCFMEEPLHMYFSNAQHGDVTQYFRFWEGNSEIGSEDGSCTGMLGFSNIPSQLRPVMIMVSSQDGQLQSKFSRRSWLKAMEASDLPLKILNLINTGTGIDPIYRANIRHLAAYCVPGTADPYLIMVLNRFGLTANSRWYLQESLQKIGWDGSPGDSGGGLQLIFVLADYYKISGDIRMIESYWPVLKRIGLWLCNQTVIGTITREKKSTQRSFRLGRYERTLWICASLYALGELGNILGKNSEVQVFKNYFLILWTKTQNYLLNADDDPMSDRLKPLNLSGGEELVEMLSAAYPLQLSERGNPATLARIARVAKNYLFQGGVFSPRDFKGVDLELTARLCQVVIREGGEYQDILDFLLLAASPTFGWPDRINPLSKKGIGENGHDPRVLFQTLLLIRSLFVIEEGDQLHLLPGIFCSDFWSCPCIELHDFPTVFGRISLKTRTVGDTTQINLESNFLQTPQKIIFIINQKYRVVFADTLININGGVITADPDLRMIRFRRCRA